MARNGWPACSGISGRHQTEYALHLLEALKSFASTIAVVAAGSGILRYLTWWQGRRGVLIFRRSLAAEQALSNAVAAKGIRRILVTAIDELDSMNLERSIAAAKPRSP